jgi:hypothetical protein
MNRVLKIILVILLLVVVAAISMYAYLGGFKKTVIREERLGPFSIVYKEILGDDLSQAGEITSQLDGELKAAGFVSQRPFEVFHPDGHAEIGFVFGPTEVHRLSALGNKYRLKYISAGTFMTTTFPWKMKLSYMVGFMKVEPALEEYRNKNGYRKTWAATRHDVTLITYLQPVEKE